MSETTLWMPPPQKDLSAAKRQFVERYGSIAVMNTYLKIALIAQSFVCLGLLVLNMRNQELLRNFKPVIVRVNEVGRAEAVKYPEPEYQPQEREIKYFLTDFVQRHYSRMRATLRENYARSLYFLDGRLADALMEADRKTKDLEGFLAGSGEEIEVHVRSVAIEDLRTSPYRATVDFDKVYYAPDRTATRKEKYIANFVFVIKDHVPNAMIPVNPLGLTITYFRQDQTFE